MANLYKPCICTMSLGRCFAGHSMEHKLEMAKKYGFQGVEIFYEDLVDFAVSTQGGNTPECQLQAAVELCELCHRLGLTILCLQPFMNSEGLADRKLREKRVEEMHFWIQLAQSLNTDLIMLPSNILPASDLTDDMTTIVHDMIDLADIGAKSMPPIKFAYEALCWGTRVNTWEASWDIVERVNRPNFGICFDTFNLAGRVFADPANASGVTPDCHAATARSLRRIISQVDLSKVFLLQVADAEKMAGPIDSSHPFYHKDQPARMSWSRNARLFYGEEDRGGYLPVKQVLDTIVHELGYVGWISFEVFSRNLAETGEHVPEALAKRAAKSWSRLEADLMVRAVSSGGDVTRTQAML